MSPHPSLTAILLAVVAAGHIGRDSSPDRQAPGQPVFSVRSDLVVLHVVVKDRRGGYVTDLPQDAFRVFEDRVAQPIQLFVTQDAPATVGLLIDSSGSMAQAREKVIAAVGSFAEASNPADEIFALTFNERVHAVLPPEHPFTGDAGVLRAALAGTIRARGLTAMQDAIALGLRYVAQGSHQTQALVVVADGGDNASTMSFDDLLREAQASNAVIYTIALPDPVDRTASPRRLRRLAEASGGESFAPRDVNEIDQVLRRVALELRHTYTIGYAPADTSRSRGLRRVRVEVEAPGHTGLNIRARHGWVNEER
jgi:VWFA-related protein